MRKDFDDKGGIRFPFMNCANDIPSMTLMLVKVINATSSPPSLGKNEECPPR